MQTTEAQIISCYETSSNFIVCFYVYLNGYSFGTMVSFDSELNFISSFQLSDFYGLSNIFSKCIYLKEEIVVEDDVEEDLQIVKRKDIEMKPMDEEEAILQMDLINHDFFVFKNIDEECVSVIYKRKDGKYGIINVK